MTDRDDFVLCEVCNEYVDHYDDHIDRHALARCDVKRTVPTKTVALT